MPKKPRWNELPCPECKEPVEVDAKRCPHCQGVYPDSWVDARRASHASGQKAGVGCLVVVGILLLGTCAFFSSGEDKFTEPWSGSWSDPTAEVTQTLAAKGIRGCGEFYQKKNAKFEGDFAVACTRTPDGKLAWTGYEVFVGTREVMGPDLTAVYTQFGGPPRQLTKDDL